MDDARGQAIILPAGPMFFRDREIKCATVVLLAFHLDHTRLQTQLAGPHRLPHRVVHARRCRNAIATTFALGNASRAISTRFAASSSWCTKIPVTLPPGCDRLATYPFARGSKLI